MRRLCLPALSLLLIAAPARSTPPSAATTLLRVVLVAGQSNADGRADSSGLPTSPVNYQAVQANVPFYHHVHGTAAQSDGTLGRLTTLRTGATQFPSGGFGPEIGLGHALSRVIETLPGSRLALIKYAKGGSNLHTDWKAGGDATTSGDGPHYRIFQQVVTAGLASLKAAHPQSRVELVGLVWIQGESDIDSGVDASAAYGAHLTAFIADLRATFSPTLPFIFSRISANQTVYSSPSAPNHPAYLTLRAQQASVAATVSDAHLIDTDNPAFAVKSDHLHYGPLGQLALGQAFAAKLIHLLGQSVTGTMLNTLDAEGLVKRRTGNPVGVREAGIATPLKVTIDRGNGESLELPAAGRAYSIQSLL